METFEVFCRNKLVTFLKENFEVKDQAQASGS
jgi:hypothetical protein